MKPIRIVLPFVLVLLGVLVAAGCGGSDQTVPSNAVAVVDGAEISKSELDALLARAKKSYVSQKREFPKVGTSEYQSLQTQAVAFLVQRAEYDREAKDLDITVTEEDVDARVKDVLKTYFAGDQKKLDKQLAEQGYTVATFRADIRSQLVSEKIYQDVTKDLKATDADARKYYDENQAQYEVPESREVRHILVKTRAEAEDVLKQLEAGGDFAAIAKKVSLDPGSKNAGGKLTITKGQTVAPFDQSAFLLDTNELSKPIKTEFGYHVIQPVGDVKPGKTTAFEDVRAQIKKTLAETKKNEAIQRWAADVKKEYESKVSYAAGFAPPATSTPSDTTDSTTG